MNKKTPEERAATVYKRELAKENKLVPTKKLESNNTPTYGSLRAGQFVPSPIKLRAHIGSMTLEMVDKIAELARSSDNEFLQLAAAKFLVEQYIGKPQESISVEDHRQPQEIRQELLTPEQRKNLLEVIDMVENRDAKKLS